MYHLLLLLYCFIILPFYSIAQKKTSTPSRYGISFILPVLNNYAYYNYESQLPSSKSGFIGFGAGLFYQKGDHKLSFNTGVAYDAIVPLAPIDYTHTGTRTSISSTYGEIVYHRRIFNRLYIAAGISGVQYRFRHISYEDTLAGFTRTDRTWGLSFGVEYSVIKFFSAGISYRPALLSQDHKQYFHLLTVDTRFHLNLARRK